MRFAISAEQDGFARAVRDLLDSAAVPAATRAWIAGDFAPGRKLWARLSDVGLTALGRPDFGASPVDLVLAFTELGRAAAPGPYVESVAVLPLLTQSDPEKITTLAAPPVVPYACDAAAADAVYLLDGRTLCAAEADTEIRSVDPSRRLASVRATDAMPTDVDAAGAFERGALATAAQLHGAGLALLDRSVDYAKQRQQFGAAIGTFQAVKHQLANVHVELELSRPLLFGAALSLSARDVSAAKVACSHAAYRAARVALQVHGAIGYTAEYDLSLWLTKVRALVSAWGTQSFHRARVLAALRAQR